MAELSIPLTRARAKKGASISAPGLHSSIPKMSRVALRETSNTVITSSGPPPSTKSTLKSKLTSQSSIPALKSSRNALRPKTASASISKVNPNSLSTSRSRPSLNPSSRTLSHNQPKPSSIKSPITAPTTDINTGTGNNSDINKSLALAQEMISIQKERENLLGIQIKSLQDDKTELQQNKSKIQEDFSVLERNSHALMLKISELEHAAELTGEKQTYANELRVRDLIHEHQVNVNNLQHKFKTELESALEKCKKEASIKISHEEQLMKDNLKVKEEELSKTLERERNANKMAIDNMTTLSTQTEAAFQLTKKQMEKEINQLQDERNDFKRKSESLEAEIEATKLNLSTYQAEAADNFYTYQAEIKQLKIQVKEQQETIHQLKSNVDTAEMEKARAKEKLFHAENSRRKLHNQIQELKGNIRVFCRVRPSLTGETGLVELNFPDSEEEGQQLQLAVQNIGGGLTNNESPNKIHSFSFDKVFNPSSTNETIFEEVSQLVQSALDGFNVCIFAYGQTGSGKTFTMSSATNGIIPLAINQIFQSAELLKDIGWEYEFYGEFLEIYNEKILDLLKSDEVEKKYEIRHDPLKRNTTVTGLTSVKLDNSDQACLALDKASRNRSVAATLANERSSRSHSVFILRLSGFNKISGKTLSGVLNLIDLAGSERLSHSQVTGDRLKETQAINKSLSSLGDVIGALGNAKDGSHIPYRNSKLTYLLQYSLSGTSKTLMMVNISPLQSHANETINSLRFATKVNNTHVGNSKRLA